MRRSPRFARPQAFHPESPHWRYRTSRFGPTSVRSGNASSTSPARWRGRRPIRCECLSQRIALMTAGRTAIPVVVARRLAVIQVGNLLRPEDFLLRSVINPVLDILFVQVTEAEDALLARVARIVGRITVSAIGARSDKAVGYSARRIDVGIAGATTE